MKQWLTQEISSFVAYAVIAAVIVGVIALAMVLY